MGGGGGCVLSDFKQYLANRSRSKRVSRIESTQSYICTEKFEEKKSMTVVGLGINFLPKLNHTPAASSPPTSNWAVFTTH